LAKQYDIIVIEGAGSPVELNLKSDDIVNMGMAKIADASVFLVGDIDRGGVFAQLLGTLALLEQDERERVKGLIVNKFRGDISLFADGVKILEEKGKKPVVGVVPYLHCDIEDEDSLSDKLLNKTADEIDIAVIRLPRISNFTDFDVFGQFKNVSVRYIEKCSEFGDPDMIIIPGSKSVISDMKWLRESGIEAAVKRNAFGGTPIFGICGGYQMLGKLISDPYSTESGGEILGIGLLEMKTVFHTEKTRTRVSGIVTADGGDFPALYGAHADGYEIHMGETVGIEKPLLKLSDGRTDGAYKNNIYGSYLHGFFDSEEVVGVIINAISERKGIAAKKTINRSEYKERQYDLLADGVRKSIDMQKIYEMI
ncbi:MAG: cobyric acid synthase, partial [Oscillospiraceae bacterium]|nr:cobyric acid synthase [Oscillospiraceae bacterium]